jgi:hypothetical protein
MNEEEKELLENFRNMSEENQSDMLTYARATRRGQYGILPESNPANGFKREGHERLAFQ